MSVGSRRPGESLLELREKLDRCERLQRAAGALAQVGGFEIDGVTRQVVWSPQLSSIHGLPEGEAPDLDRWLRLYTSGVRAKLRAAIERALAHGKSWDFELHILRKDGVALWVRCQGRAEVEDGRVRRLCGAMRDITDSKIAAEQVRETLAEVDDARRSSERQTFELARQAAELALAREAAEEAARMKSAFLATMSHEIRTPMNGVLGMVSLLDGTSMSGEQREYLDTIRVSGESLLEIINDVLDYSKTEAGMTRFASKPFDLARCCEEAAEILAAKAAAKRIDLSVFVSPACPPELRGDPGRLRQVLVNLVANALKFTETGRVMVNVEPVRAGQGGLRFEVTDTGIGIPRNALPSLFQPFTQADSGATRRFGGTGLGLSICKQIVEGLGGSIGAFSEPGEGSTFWFELDLPVARPPSLSEAAPLANANAVILARSQGLRDTLSRYLNARGACVALADSIEAAEQAIQASPPRFLLVESSAPFGFDIHAITALSRRRPDIRPAVLSWPDASEIEEARGLGLDGLYRPVKRGRLLAWLAGRSVEVEANGNQPAYVVSLRVLVAEDNPVNQRIVMKMLERLGHDATLAVNGREAVARARSEPFDLILMDCQMPEMDGFQAAREIRRRGPLPPIVALTANALEDDRQRCLDAGMDDYLPKPIDLAGLGGMIQRWSRPAPAAQSV